MWVKGESSLMNVGWPNIVEQSKRILVISRKVARGEPLKENKKQQLADQYQCPLVLEDMHEGGTFLILSAVFNKLSISVLTSEDASHIMICSDYCETHMLATYNVFASFDSDIFCTISFASRAVFFNKEHRVSEAYSIYVTKCSQPEINTVFEEFFQKVSEMIRLIAIQNNQEAYKHRYFNLSTANRYLEQINMLCGCELSLGVHDFPKWLRSAVG